MAYHLQEDFKFVTRELGDLSSLCIRCVAGYVVENAVSNVVY